MNTHKSKEKAVIEFLRSKGVDAPYATMKTWSSLSMIFVFAPVMLSIGMLIPMVNEDVRSSLMDELT